MRILIVEDEIMAAKNLERRLLQVDPSISIIAVIESIEEGRRWFSDPDHPMPELIFSDIQLADGLSFDLFKDWHITIPIIFTTAYDQYAIEAFQLNSINYLLKPIRASELEKSINQFKELRDQFTIPDIAKLSARIGKTHRSRFLVYRGENLISIETKHIQYFYSHQGICLLTTTDGEQYSVSDTLDTIEKEVDHERYFRANRQFLISIDSIESVKQYLNRKLKVRLLPDGQELTVSKEKVPEFKQWLGS